MQGFIKTTAGLRPVLLDGIEEVTYTTNSGGLYHTGSLGIKYIPNSGTGTGNIFINVPAYDDLQYPIEKFWDWVNSVSAGQNKTYNQFLGSGVVLGAVVGTITTSAGLTPTTGYVIQIADDLSMDDICALVFDTDAAGGPNYTNVLTNGQSTPAVFDHIFISSQQGYNPFEAGLPGSSDLFPSPNNAALPNGTYAFLAGTPQATEKGSTFDQTGSIYRVVVKTGIIESIEVCPQVFDVMDIKGWIKSIFDFEGPVSCNPSCAQVAICNGCNLDEASWNTGNPQGSWYPVMFAFNLPLPTSGLPEDPAFDPCYQVTYGGNFTAVQQLIPVGASSYIKGFYDTAYVPMVGSSQIKIGNVPEPQYIGLGSLSDYGAMFTSPLYLNNYVFTIDWGAEGYNDCEGNPITAAYFKHDPTPTSEGAGCLEPPAKTFASFQNNGMLGEVMGYAEFPCITQAGGGGQEA